MIATWENEFGTAQRVNAGRPLTRSLDRREEGLAMHATRTCSITECDTRVFGHGWCQRHYNRWRRTGDPLGLRRRTASADPCAVEGCDRRAHGRGWCKMHHHRFLRTGSPDVVRPIGYTPPGPTHPSWQGDNITYLRAHRRLDSIRGRASSHACVDCGGPAAEWSYDGLDPDQKTGTGRSPYAYSVKPEHYHPRCVRCHRQFDIARREATA